MNNLYGKDFLKQLKQLKESFLAEASEYGKINKKTFEVELCDRYLLFRVEGDDFVVKQEITMEYDSVYQGTLTPEAIYTEN